MRQRLQMGIDGNKTRDIGLQSAGARPRRCRGTGHPDHFIKRQAFAAAQQQRARRDTVNGCIQAHADALMLKNGHEALLYAPRMHAEDRRPVADQRESCAAAIAGNTVLHRQHHLHTRGAGPDHDDLQRSRRRTCGFAQLRPEIEELRHRFHRNAMPFGARDGRQHRRRAGVDGQHIEGLIRRMAATRDARGKIDCTDAGANARDAGLRADGIKVDMAVGVAVMPGDITRQHARVRRVAIGTDQRHRDARLGGEAPAANHLDMAVTAADQQQAFGHCRITAFSRPLAVAPAARNWSCSSCNGSDFSCSNPDDNPQPYKTRPSA